MGVGYMECPTISVWWSFTSHIVAHEPALPKVVQMMSATQACPLCAAQHWMDLRLLTLLPAAETQRLEHTRH